jgi:hypothetical protein
VIALFHSTDAKLSPTRSRFVAVKFFVVPSSVRYVATVFVPLSDSAHTSEWYVGVMPDDRTHRHSNTSLAPHRNGQLHKPRRSRSSLSATSPGSRAMLIGLNYPVPSNMIVRCTLSTVVSMRVVPPLRWVHDHMQLPAQPSYKVP